MKIPWKNILHITAAVVGQIIPGVQVAEQIATSLGDVHGQAKQDAVVELVKSSLMAADSLVGHQLASDADVEKATRGVIDAVVSLHNIVAAKAIATS